MVPSLRPDLIIRPAGISCPGDRLLWCNTPSLIYHFQGERYFGCTRTGEFHELWAKVSDGVMR